MTEPPPRKRFQIHLSTVLMLTLTSGWLMYMNSIPEPVYVEWWDGHGVPPVIDRWDYGWPYLAIVNHSKNRFKEDPFHPSAFRVNEIVIDLIVALAILIAIYFLCEYLIRRRAARKGA